MKKLLLVGASGFLGAHIKQSYVSDGWKVITIGRTVSDDLILDSSSLERMLGFQVELGVSRIVHAAAINETLIKDDLVTAYDINVTMTRLLMELARIHHVPEFVYISTFHVYGISSGIVSQKTLKAPKNDYALTHYLSENIVTNLGREYGIKVLIVRPTNIYGIPIAMEKFSRWSLVPFDFVRTALDSSRIKIRSTGLQQRNFVGVEDVVKSTHLVGKYDEVNAYGLDTLSIREFALQVSNIVSEISLKRCEVSWAKSDGDCVEVDEKLALVCDNNGYQPEQSIQHFIESFVKVLHREY